eukprot:9077837-Alexandrium_andersonii.AAC.1
MIALATGCAAAAPGSKGLGAAHLLLRSIGMGALRARSCGQWPMTRSLLESPRARAVPIRP